MEVKNNTFWGLILQPGKRYEQIVEKSFHVSMAALDVAGGEGNALTQVMVNVDGQEFILCHLNKKGSPQQALDLNFQSGDSLALYVDGQSPLPVHLTGFYNEMEDDEDMDGLMMSDDEEDEEEEVPDLVPAKLASSLKKKKQENGTEEQPGAKRKTSPAKESPQKKSKVQPMEEDSDDDEEEEDDEDEEDDDEEEADDDEGEDEEVEEGFSDDDDEDEDDEDDDEDDEDEDDDDEDESDEEEEESKPVIPLKKTKSPPIKQEKSSPSAAVGINGTAGGDVSPKKKKKDGGEQAQKTPGKEAQDKKPPQTPKSAKKTLPGGVMIEDLVVGSGPVAKKGRPVSVYYVGRLKQNNKLFDQTVGGPGFKFRLGGKEVIKGWDVGVEGMKVGGKRRITCPPHMAYGARGSPPVIPPNSALMFEVTLKNVH